MVLKPCKNVTLTFTQFENDVKMYGTQASKVLPDFQI